MADPKKPTFDLAQSRAALQKVKDHYDRTTEELGKLEADRPEMRDAGFDNILKLTQDVLTDDFVDIATSAVMIDRTLKGKFSHEKVTQCAKHASSPEANPEAAKLVEKGLAAGKQGDKPLVKLYTSALIAEETIDIGQCLLGDLPSPLPNRAIPIKPTDLTPK